MSLCLSAAEIAELTRAKTKVRQLAFLRTNGIRHYIDRNGRPVVTRAAVIGLPDTEHARPKWKPNKA